MTIRLTSHLMLGLVQIHGKHIDYVLSEWEVLDGWWFVGGRGGVKGYSVAVILETPTQNQNFSLGFWGCFDLTPKYYFLEIAKMNYATLCCFFLVNFGSIYEWFLFLFFRRRFWGPSQAVWLYSSEVYHGQKKSSVILKSS